MLTNVIVRRVSCSLNAALVPRGLINSRALHSSSSLWSISPLRMPALSPTMEAGQISKWNLSPGSRFSAGDILLTVETDKAEVDVEAQEDGYMGPQLVAARTTIKVGEVIAVIGEEEGDISSDVEIPIAWKSSADPSVSAAPPVDNSTDRIKSTGTTAGACSSSTSDNKNNAEVYANLHPISKMPLSPAVSRILIEHNIGDATAIKGTGLNGRLTKGDILYHLGKVSSPVGSAKEMMVDDAKLRALEKSTLSSAPVTTEVPPKPPMDGPSLRRFITDGLILVSQSEASLRAVETPTFDSILQGYHCAQRPATARPEYSTSYSTLPVPAKDAYFDGLSP